MKTEFFSNINFWQDTVLQMHTIYEIAFNKLTNALTKSIKTKHPQTK